MRTNPSPLTLAETLFPRIERQEWDVVAQLAFQLLDKYNEGAGDELIGRLLAAGADRRRTRDVRTNYLTFAVRTLGFLVPNSSLSRRVGSTAIEFLVDQVSLARAGKVRGDNRVSLAQIMLALGEVNAENNRWVSGVVGESLATAIQADVQATGIAAVDVAAGLSLVARGFADVGELQLEDMQPWRRVAEGALQAASPSLKRLAASDYFVALVALNEGVGSLTSVVESFGTDVMFRRMHHFSIDEDPGSFASELLDWATTIVWQRVNPPPRIRGWIEEAATLLRTAEVPWTLTAPMDLLGIPYWFARQRASTKARPPTSVTKDATFVVLALLAASVEQARVQQRVLHAFERSGRRDLQVVGQILAAALNGNELPNPEALSELRLDDHQTRWVRDWVSGKIRVTGQTTLGLS